MRWRGEWWSMRARSSAAGGGLRTCRRCGGGERSVEETVVVSARTTMMLSYDRRSYDFWVDAGVDFTCCRRHQLQLLGLPAVTV